MTDNPVRPNIIKASPLTITTPERVTRDTEHRALLIQMQRESERRKEDLVTEVTRLEAEIDARHTEIAREDYVLQSLNAALTIELVAK